MTVHEARDSWMAVLGELQLKVTRPSYETWLRDTVGLACTNTEFVVRAPSPFVAEMLENRMYSTINQAVQRVVGSSIDVRFTVDQHSPRDSSPLLGEPSEKIPEGAQDNQAPQQEPAALNPKYTFDTYVVGKSNDLAHAASLAVAERPGSSYNPLLIYSGVGLGKTHLLHAIGHRAAAIGLQPTYLTTEEFTNEYIKAIRESRTDAFRDRYRSAGLLLLDDIQFLIGKEQTQEGFFHTFNALHMAGRQIVITSDRPVTELTLLENRVSSRLAGGLVVDIQPPDLETRLAILRNKADAGGHDFPSTVIEFLAERIHKNVRELEGTLNRVAAYSQLTGEPVTLSLVKKTLVDSLNPGRTKRVSDKVILEAVSSYFEIDSATLKGRQRDKQTSRARHVAMYLLREEAQLSLSAIGTILGGKDHSTVLHGYHRISSQLSTDSHLRQDIIRITDSFLVT